MYSKIASQIWKESKDRVKYDERVTYEKQDGKWNVVKDVLNFGYVVLTHPDYPNRLVYKMIDEVKVVSKRMLEGNLNESQFANELSQISKRYEDPAATDRLTQANAQVDEVRVQLNHNFEDLIKNQTNLDHMEQNTGHMKNAAMSFNKDSTEVKKIMWWRNAKLMIAIVVGSVLLITIIILIIVYTTK